MLSRGCSGVVKRCASAAAARQSGTIPAQEKVSRLPNGLTLATVERSGAVSQLVFAFRAGTRYEMPDEAGLVHLLRNLVGTDSRRYLGVQMLWQCGSAGASLVSSATRDLFQLQMGISREHAAIGLSLLGEMAQPAFKPWDVETVTPSLKVDVAYVKPEELLSDKLHYAAFRSGPLGNAMFVREDEIGQIDHHKLTKYSTSRLISGQAVLVGVNVDHNMMLTYANEQLNITESHGQRGTPSPYMGGEARHPCYKSDLAYVSLAGKGASLLDPKGAAIHAVLSAALVQGLSMKHSPGADNGAVSEAVFKASNGDPYSISPVSEIYSDAGLLGFTLVMHGDRAGALVSAAAAALKSFSMNESALQTAKKIAKTNVLIRSQCSSEIAVDCAAQLLATGNLMSVADFLSLVDSVSDAEVNTAAKQLTSRLTVAAVGNIYQVPYLDQL